jgi:hypothetical protein
MTLMKDSSSGAGPSARVWVDRQVDGGKVTKTFVVPAQAGTQRLVAASQELGPGLRRDDGYVDSGIHRWIRWPQKGSRSAPRRA